MPIQPDHHTPSADPRSRIDYSKDLNSAQMEAVTHGDGPLLVIAGAGSGKTRTLTYRVAYLVENSVPPDRLLLLTFTRKAAGEMLLRAETLLDQRCRKVAGGTFHSFANLMLRRYGPAIDLARDFSIMDRVDSESLIAMLRKEMGPLPGGRRFPTKRTLAAIFSRAVNKVRSVAEIIDCDYPHLSRWTDAVSELHRAYAGRKRELSAVDYDDLLVYFQTLLETQADIRRHIQETFRYVMVDEYQDTNRIQAEIVYLLSRQEPNIMVVGDDSQSIYAFRGANYENIMTFPERFEGTRIIRLEENYRSVQPILDLTNRMIDQAAHHYSKRLFTRKTGGSPPLLIAADRENSQSLMIIEKIRTLQRQGTALDEMAVLFRAGFHSFDLEIELAREGIDFVKVGGFKFMESAHIKDVLAHLRVIAFPADCVSWYRVLMLIEKIGPRTAERIFDSIAAEHAGTAGLLSADLRTAAHSKGIVRLRELIAALDGQALSVAAMGEAVLKYYLPLLKDRYDDHPKRTRDLEQLAAIMERYGNLQDFLTDMALEPPSASHGVGLAGDQTETRRLVLSTVHSAKGLEWRTVFVIWTLDGRFPSVHAFGDTAALEEELRLLYVAATRARENLFFVYPGQLFDRGSGQYFDRPARFLDRLPEEVLARHWAQSGFWPSE